MNHSKFYLGTLLLGLFVLAPAAPAATISYLGMQADINDQWRTTTLLKPLDGDGNNVYGSDGYSMFGGAGFQSLPSYVSGITATSIYPGNGSYISIDDPTATPGPSVANVGTGTANPQPGTGNAGNAVSFTVTGTIPTFNVTLLNDNLDGTGFNAGAFRVFGNGGGATGDSGLVTVTNGNQVPDAYVFQISGAQAGNIFTVGGTGGPNGYVTVGAVGFDTAVPEPSGIALAMLGALALGICNRRRVAALRARN